MYEATDKSKILSEKPKEMFRPNDKIKKKLLPHCYNIYRPNQGDKSEDEYDN